MLFKRPSTLHVVALLGCFLILGPRLIGELQFEPWNPSRSAGSGYDERQPSFWCRASSPSPEKPGMPRSA